jgi:hypothetical protein
LLLPVLLTASMWMYAQYILIPHQHAEADAKGAPRGNLSDLYPRWLGARELLLHGRDPYGNDITREIQRGYYGRELDAARPNDPKDEQAFAYPVYVVLMLAPTITLPFATVKAMMFWLFVALTALSVRLWLQTLGWQITRMQEAIWIILTLGCFPAIQGVKLQQLTVLVVALLAAAMNALVTRRFILAGGLLALATIKPQLVVLLVLWLFVWVVGNWRERQRVLWSFAITVAALVGAGELLLPGWIHEFRGAVASYYRYTGGGTSVLDVLLLPKIGRVTSLALVSLMLSLTWRLREKGRMTSEFQWSFCFVMATTLLVIPTFAPYNQLLLLPAVMLLVRARSDLWRKGAFFRAFVATTAASVFWSYFAALVLVIALLFWTGTTVQGAWNLPFYSNFAIPITIYASLLIARKQLCLQPSGEVAGAERILQPNAAAE